MLQPRQKVSFDEQGRGGVYVYLLFKGTKRFCNLPQINCAIFPVFKLSTNFLFLFLFKEVCFCRFWFDWNCSKSAESIQVNLCCKSKRFETFHSQFLFFFWPATESSLQGRSKDEKKKEKKKRETLKTRRVLHVTMTKLRFNLREKVWQTILYLPFFNLSTLSIQLGFLFS